MILRKNYVTEDPILIKEKTTESTGSEEALKIDHNPERSRSMSISISKARKKFKNSKTTKDIWDEHTLRKYIK